MDGGREEGREACGGGPQDGNHETAEGCCMASVLSESCSPSLLSPSPLAVSVGQCEHVADDGLWAQVVDAAPRPGTGALGRPPSCPRPAPQ